MISLEDVTSFIENLWLNPFIKNEILTNENMDEKIAWFKDQTKNYVKA